MSCSGSCSPSAFSEAGLQSRSTEQNYECESNEKEKSCRVEKSGDGVQAWNGVGLSRASLHHTVTCQSQK
ncbi:hypothetical protein EYF80_025728 [Liparis tanakae]|uniref:Uncharacterized protein n=1 Tax=Liparis tanakae TaxID=230148 RepID=A0A4Z2HFD3_9TELE|nr:hypothetical protein EYF80_025728 [Liparis tanakae]